MYIKIHAVAGAKHEVFKQDKDDHFKIAVKEPAEGNRANKRIIELIASHFVISPKKVRLVSGHHKPSKIFYIEGVESRSKDKV